MCKTFKCIMENQEDFNSSNFEIDLGKDMDDIINSFIMEDEETINHDSLNCGECMWCEEIDILYLDCVNCESNSICYSCLETEEEDLIHNDCGWIEGKIECMCGYSYCNGCETDHRSKYLVYCVVCDNGFCEISVIDEDCVCRRCLDNFECNGMDEENNKGCEICNEDYDEDEYYYEYNGKIICCECVE